MNGTATTCSSATASGCSAHTSSTAAATRRWGPPGATSTSRRSAVRRLGRTRQGVTPRPRRTSGGTGTTTTPPRPRLTGSGSRCPTREKPPSESATQRRKRAKERRPLRRLRAASSFHTGVAGFTGRAGSPFQAEPAHKLLVAQTGSDAAGSGACGLQQQGGHLAAQLVHGPTAGRAGNVHRRNRPPVIAQNGRTDGEV